jgi:plastocyanin
MQARVRIITFLVVIGCVLALLFVLNANAEPGSLRAAEGAPAGTDDRSILITAQGLSEAAVAIDTGATVTWVNQTDSKVTLASSGYQAYLPLLMTGSQVQACAAIRRTAHGAGRGGLVQPAWGGDIEPGGSYSRTFTSAGDYRYYLAGHPAWPGRVLVRTPGAGTSTPTITASPTSYRSVFVDGCVWDDLNGNGQIDPGEVGIGGVAVELWQVSGPIEMQRAYATVVSSGNGAYALNRTCDYPTCDPMTAYEVRVASENFQQPGGILRASTPTTGEVVGALGADGYVRLHLGGQGVYSDKNFGFGGAGTPTLTVMPTSSATPTATPTTCRSNATSCGAG